MRFRTYLLHLFWLLSFSLEGFAESYYISNSGNDDHRGTSQDTAWKSFRNVNSGTFLPGDSILLERGSRWDDGISLESEQGSEAAPIQLGAYGDSNADLPVLQGVNLSSASYIHVSELEIDGQGNGRIDASEGAHHLFIHRNVIHDTGDHAIRFFGPSHHNIVMGNFIYDVGGSGHAIAVHAIDSGDQPAQPGYAYWIVDNDIVGSENMENLIDIAPDALQTSAPYAMDIKIAGNRLQCEAVPGLSQLQGRANSGVNSGPFGDGFWLVGNTVTGCDHAGFQIQNLVGAGKRRGIQLSGNVVFRTGLNPKHSVIVNAEDFLIEHNTIVRHDYGSRSTLFLPQYARNGIVRRNLLSIDSTLSASTAHLTATLGLQRTLKVLNHNWYSDIGRGRVTVDSLSWSQLQASGFESEGRSGRLAGIMLPSPAIDPKLWGPAFYEGLIPRSPWEICSGPDTPGAFDCDGNRLGWNLLRYPFLSNQGRGWMGNSAVQAFMNSRGVATEAPLRPAPSAAPEDFAIE